MTDVSYMHRPPPMPARTGDAARDLDALYIHLYEMDRWLQFISSGQNIADPAWTTPTLINGWLATGGGNVLPAYKVIPGPMLRIKGMIRAGVIGSPAFTLPVALRPSEEFTFATISSGITFSRINVQADGDVIPHTGSNVFFIIDCTVPLK